MAEKGSAGDSSQSMGPSTDRNNVPVVDPTLNVIRRQDDESAHIREILALRADYDEKLAAKDERLADLRERYAEQMRDTESKRLDAVRSVDQARLVADNAASEIRATALQAQVALSAEAVRTTAAAAAQAQTENMTRVIAPLQSDIASLRQAQYQQQGERQQVAESRSAISDLQPLVDKIERLIAAQSERVGAQTQVTERRQSNAALYVVIGIGSMFVFMIIAAVGLYFTVRTATGK